MLKPAYRVLVLGVALVAACDDNSSDGSDGTTPPPDADARVVRDAFVDASLDPPDGEILDVGPVWDMDRDGGPPALDASVGDAGLGDSGRDPLCLDVPQRPGQQPLALEARCRARGGPLRIRDLRDPRCPDHREWPTGLPGTEVEIAEAVVTAVFSDAFTIQDPEGGPWSALWVYNRSRQDVAALRPGTRVRVSGELIEFFTLTELVPPRGGIEILAQGQPPAPIQLSDPARIADGGDLVEPLESLLIEIPWTRIRQTAPDCPRDFGMFVVDGNLRVGGEAELDYEPARHDVLASMTGVLHFSFDHQKLFPRSDEDLEVIDCGGVPDKCEADDCPVLPDAQETGRLIITEIQNNPSGDDATREYFELYNPSPQPLAVDGWWVQDCAGNRLDLGGRIPARTFHVRARSMNRDLNGGVRADGEMGEMFLPNGYGSILVFDGDGTLVDQVRYAPGEDGWPDRRPGQAAELPEPAADNRVGEAWVAGERRYGDGGSGSPGEAWRD